LNTALKRVPDRSTFPSLSRKASLQVGYGVAYILVRGLVIVPQSVRRHNGASGLNQAL
jgi:hypothetical protein